MFIYIYIDLFMFPCWFQRRSITTGFCFSVFSWGLKQMEVILVPELGALLLFFLAAGMGGVWVPLLKWTAEKIKSWYP